MKILYFLNRVEKNLCVRKLPKVIALLVQVSAVAAGITFSSGNTAQAQCTMTCNSNVEIALFNRGNLTVTPSMIMVNPYQNCPGAQFQVKIYKDNGVLIGNYVNESHIGKFLTFQVVNLNNGSQCGGNLKVVDNLPPEILVQDAFVSCSESIDPDSIGYPVISDNISLFDSLEIDYHDIYYSFDCFHVVGDSTVSGKAERIWQAIDESGNISTEVQNIYFVRRQLNDVKFPLNRDGVQLPALTCHRDDPNDLSLTGVPTIHGNSIYDDNNCDFAVSYSDRVTDYCVGDKKILRTWTVIDWCADSTVNVIQVIRVRDFDSPVITCPDTMWFNTNNNACTATVTLSNATAHDSCSSATITTRWQFGTGTGPFHNVPIGTYEVTYTATDDCGNQITCKTRAVIKDNQAPQAICDLNKEVSLQAGGTAVIFAQSFDDGSHDNCYISKYEVRRGNLPFSDKVSFSCNDIGNPVQVELKVYDNNGFSSTCFSTVKVNDQIAPVILCPQNVTLSCTENPADLQRTGNATATDNCSAATVTYTDNAHLNNCGIGTITRTWKAQDASGNISTCTQLITLVDNTPVIVTFPDDYNTYQCGGSTDPDVAGKPTAAGANCENIEITYTDQLFATNPPACLKIIRTWTVVDWCQYGQGGNTTQGIWSDAQTITVKDTVAPVLTLPSNIIFGTGNNTCDAIVNITSATATDCGGNISIVNNSPYATNKNSPNASGTYPIGKHTVTYTATDGCGNSSTKSIVIEVVDDKAPTPICSNGITLSLNSDGTIFVTPQVLSPGSFDNCTAAAGLQLEVTPNTFTCEDLGQKTVTITATDEAGNQGFCTTTVVIQDNLQVCSSTGSKATLAGKITTLGETPGVQVLVGLTGGISMGRQTHTDGTYRFENLPKGENYKIKPVYDTDWAEGVSTMDLVIMRKHILTVEPFHSPYQWIAADANNSGTVSTLDMVVIRKIILRIASEIPGNTSWKFVDAAYSFPTNASPLSVPYPQEINITNLQLSRLKNDFVAVKIGDVNGSARLNTLTGDDTDSRSLRSSLVFMAEDMDMERGKEYEVAIKAKNFESITGFQMTLQFNPNSLEFLSFQNGAIKTIDDRNLGVALLLEGALTMSWDESKPLTVGSEESLFTIRFTALENGRLSNALSLKSSPTLAEAYQSVSTGPAHESLELLDMKLEFTAISSETELLDNMPNPFINETHIRFYTSNAGEASLKLFDVYGKLIFTVRQPANEGYNEIRLTERELGNNTGMIFYRLETSNGRSASGKMIRVGN